MTDLLDLHIAQEMTELSCQMGSGQKQHHIASVK